jgi:starch phosphorylase
MKAAFNGALNLSILDGWWAEGYSPRAGWAIGKGEDYQDDEYQDRVEAGILYDVLEREVVPLFYSRGRGGSPREWIARMKTAMGELCPVFNTNRMVGQYAHDAYAPALARLDALERDDYRRTRSLAAWRRRIAQTWNDVRITTVNVELADETHVGATVAVNARVLPGRLSTEDLDVQVYFGKIGEGRNIVDGVLLRMAPDVSTNGEGVLYTAALPCKASGTHGFTVRIIPGHEDLARPHDTGLVVWGA